MSAVPARPRSVGAPELAGLVAAIRTYRRAQRRRDAAYDQVIDEIRLAASAGSATLNEIAQACGFTTTHIRKILEGPINRRDRFARWMR